MSPITVDAMGREDWPRVRDIYAEGIATKHATFERDVPDYSEWDAAHLECCRLVARSGGQVVGWAALSPYSSRPVYSGVAELGIYVTQAARGRGVGRALLEALIAESEKNGIWTLQAGIFEENEASLRLHLSCGFRIVGRREKLGRMRGRWRDVLLLERRSPVAGD